jgi:hypothetical protein
MGYIISLVGVLSIFRMGMILWMFIYLAGMAVVVLASLNTYPLPKLTWRMQLVWIAGVIVIIGCLSYIGDDRIRNWTPHPAGYQLAWLICLVAYQHMRAIIQRDFVQKPCETHAQLKPSQHQYRVAPCCRIPSTPSEPDLNS